MRTDLSVRRHARGADGFTLIEVLIAMVILAIGLLSLEALGIGAARMVGRAERQGDYITQATTRLEGTMAQLRQTSGPTPPAERTEAIDGGSLSTQASNVGRLWTVTLTITPTEHPKETYVLTGNVFR